MLTPRDEDRARPDGAEHRTGGEPEVEPVDPVRHVIGGCGDCGVGRRHEQAIAQTQDAHGEQGNSPRRGGGEAERPSGDDDQPEQRQQSRFDPVQVHRDRPGSGDGAHEQHGDQQTSVVQ